MNVEILNVRAEYEYKRTGEPYKWNDKVYIHLDKESLLENLTARHNRPVEFYKKEVLPLALEKLKEINPTMAERMAVNKFGWRQKCGCSCPCSPGFVGDHKTGIDMHVTIKIS